MRHRFAIGLIVVLLASSDTLAQQPATTISKSELAKRLKAIQATLEQNARERQVKHVQAHKHILDALQDDRQKYHSALKEQKDYERMEREFKSLVAKLPSQKGQMMSDKQREAFVKESDRFVTKYKSTFQAAYKQAGIDTRRIKSVIETQYAKVGLNVRAEPLELGWHIHMLHEPSEPVRPIEPVCQTPPYDVGMEVLLNSIVGEVEVDEIAGTFEAWINLRILPYEDVEGWMGQLIEVPPDTKEIKYLVKVRARTYHIAFAFGLAVSGCHSYLVVHTDDIYPLTAFATGHCLAIFTWISTIPDEEQNFVFTGSFEPDDNDNRILLSAGPVVSGQTIPSLGVGGFLVGSVGTVEEMCVEFFK